MIRRMMRKNEDNNITEASYVHCLNGKKVRIDVDGQDSNNNFYVICKGSVVYNMQLFKEGFENNTPIFLTVAETGTKLIINPSAVFNVTIKEIKKE